MFKRNMQQQIIDNLKSIAKNHKYTISREADNIATRYIIGTPKKEIFRIRKSTTPSSRDVSLLSISLNKTLLWDEFDDKLLADLYITTVQEFEKRNQNGTAKHIVSAAKFNTNQQRALLRYTEKYLQHTK